MQHRIAGMSDDQSVTLQGSGDATMMPRRQQSTFDMTRVQRATEANAIALRTWSKGLHGAPVGLRRLCASNRKRSESPLQRLQFLERQHNT